MSAFGTALSSESLTDREMYSCRRWRLSLLSVGFADGRDIPEAVIRRILAFAVRSKLHFIAVTGKADIVRRAELDRQSDARSTKPTLCQIWRRPICDENLVALSM